MMQSLYDTASRKNIKMTDANDLTQQIRDMKELLQLQLQLQQAQITWYNVSDLGRHTGRSPIFAY